FTPENTPAKNEDPADERSRIHRISSNEDDRHYTSTCGLEFTFTVDDCCRWVRRRAFGDRTRQGYHGVRRGHYGTRGANADGALRHSPRTEASSFAQRRRTARTPLAALGSAWAAARAFSCGTSGVGVRDQLFGRAAFRVGLYSPRQHG